MKKCKEISKNVMQCSEVDGDSVTSFLPFRKGDTRTDIDEDGNETTVDVWAEAVENFNATLLTEDDLTNAEKEQERQVFKAQRQKLLIDSTVEISTGKLFDADETSITRMSESIQAVKHAIEAGLIESVNEYALQWVLHGSETGAGTDITYIELVEACALANANRARIWLKPK